MNRAKRRFLWPIWSLLALFWMAALPLVSCASACSCPCSSHLMALAAAHGEAAHDDDDCDECESAAPVAAPHAHQVASHSHLCGCQANATPAFVAADFAAPTSHFEALAPLPVAAMPPVSRSIIDCVFRPRGHSPPCSFVPLLRASRAPPAL